MLKDHPTFDEMYDFSSKRPINYLPEERHERIFKHLQQCPNCLALSNQIEQMEDKLEKTISSIIKRQIGGRG